MCLLNASDKEKRMMILKHILLAGVSLFLVGAPQGAISRAAEPDSPKTHIVIDNVCAWPNLELLPGGDVLAFIFNQPCHGTWEGNVECWASKDSGQQWEKRG